MKGRQNYASSTEPRQAIASLGLDRFEVCTMPIRKGAKHGMLTLELGRK
jgi:hypothetical protein